MWLCMGIAKTFLASKQGFGSQNFFFLITFFGRNWVTVYLQCLILHFKPVV